MQVLFGLEFAHAMPDIKEAFTVEAMRFHDSNSGFQIQFADVTNSVITPLESIKTMNQNLASNGNQKNNEDFSGKTGIKFRLGGLSWNLPEGHRMEDYLLFWIGSDNPAFTNFILTFNSCEIGKRGEQFLALLCSCLLLVILVSFTQMKIDISNSFDIIN